MRALILSLLSLILVACSATPSPTLEAKPTATPVPTPVVSGLVDATDSYESLYDFQRPSISPPKRAMATEPEVAAAPVASGPGFTVLVVGNDSSASRRAAGNGTLTDSMMVVNVNPVAGSVNFVSLARDMVDVPMANGVIYTGKINSIQSQYGMQGLIGAVATLLNTPIDYYVQVDMDDFARAIDGLGGVSVYAPVGICDSVVNLCIGPGQHWMNGATALTYARSRKTTSDYDRMRRQQDLIVAVANRLREVEVAQYAGFASGLGTLQTNINWDQMLHLGAVAQAMSVNPNLRITKLVMGPEYATFEGMAGARGWVYVPNIGMMRGYVANTFSR